MLPINREDCWSEECLVILVSYGLLVLVVRQALEALPLFCDPGRFLIFYNTSWFLSIGMKVVLNQANFGVV
jgi:hypothetical protein